jgi:hypothetical protein
MPNTKAVGVAYADPSFESVTVSGAIVAASVALYQLLALYQAVQLLRQPQAA